MVQKQVGNVIVSLNGKTLGFQPADRTTPRIEIDAVAAGELVDFLRSALTNELNQRSAFRVPVLAESGLSATVRIDEMTYEAIPRNISLTGIFVEMATNDAPEMSPQASVTIILHFGDETVSLDGLVMRREQNGYGIMFGEAVSDASVDPPPSLTRIVMELQRRWVAQRIEGT